MRPACRPRQSILQAENEADVATQSPEAAEDELLPDDKGEEGLPSEFTRKAAKQRRVVRHEDISVPQDIRQLVTRLMGDIDGPDIRDALTRALESKDDALAATAATALASHIDRGHPLADGSLERLIQAMSSTEQELRVAAIRAVIADGSASAHDTLLCLLSHEDSATRREAADTLFPIDGSGEWIESILSDPDADVRQCILRQLTGARDPRGCTGLINVITAFPRSHHLHAAKFLHHLDREEVVEILLHEARTPENPALRPFLLEAIEQLYV